MPGSPQMQSVPHVVRVADGVLRQHRLGSAPWQRPWHADELPFNPVSGKRYKGENCIHLAVQPYHDPRWLLLRQAQQMGGVLRPGERATPVVVWQTTEEQVKRNWRGKPVLDADGQPVKLVVRLQQPIQHTRHVWNAEQFDGLPEYERKPNTWDRVVRAEAIVRASAASIEHGHSRTGYDDEQDALTLQDRQSFPQGDAYYAEALRALSGWTGHGERLDRDLTHPPGSTGHARESFRRELAAMLVGQEIGLRHTPPSHADTKAWIRLIQNDPRELSRAAADAEKAVSYLFALERAQQLEHSEGRTQVPAAQPLVAGPEHTRVQDGLAAGVARAKAVVQKLGILRTDDPSPEASDSRDGERGAQPVPYALVGREGMGALRPGAAEVAGPEATVPEVASEDDASGDQTGMQDGRLLDPRLEIAKGAASLMSLGEHIPRLQAQQDTLLSLRQSSSDPSVHSAYDEKVDELRQAKEEREAILDRLDPNRSWDYRAEYEASDDGEDLNAYGPDPGLVDEVAVQDAISRVIGADTDDLMPQTPTALSQEVVRAGVARTFGTDEAEELETGAQMLGAQDGIARTIGVDPEDLVGTSAAVTAPSEQAIQASVARTFGTDEAQVLETGAQMLGAQDGIARTIGVDPEDLVGAPEATPVFQAPSRPSISSGRGRRQTPTAEPATERLVEAPTSVEPPAQDVPGKGRDVAPKDKTMQSAPKPRRPRSHGHPKLAVPYDERHEAMKLGAAWDHEVKVWYAKPGASLERLMQRWDPAQVAVEQTPTIDPKEEFSAMLREMGFVPSDRHPVVMDGKRHRCPVEGDAPGATGGFYVGYLNGHPAGFAENHRTRERRNWKAKGYCLDAETKGRMKAVYQAKEQQRREARELGHANAAQQAQARLKRLQPVQAPTPYMQSKGISVQPGVFTDGRGNTSIPLRDADGKLWALQTIWANGTKQNAEGARRAGLFHTVGSRAAVARSEAIVVCEGYSTGVTLAELLNRPVIVGGAHSNLAPVAQALREKFPDKPIIIAADDDQHVKPKPNRPGNPGLQQAQKAAKLVGGTVLKPRFAPGEQERDAKGFTDFNDLATKSALGRKGASEQVLQGFEAVVAEHRKALVQQQTPQVRRSMSR